MSPDRVRLGSLGLGWWGAEMAQAVQRSGQAEIVSCFARGAEGRNRFAERFGCRAAGSLDEFLTDPEIEGVLIATSHKSHRPLTEQAASAGKHVFLEKPLTTTVADGVACIDAARRAGVILQVGHLRRRTAANRRLKALLEAGDLGDVETVVAHQSIPNGFRMPAGAWRWSPEESPLGSMTSLGVHKIDTMHYLVGPIRRVSAFTRPGRDHPIDEATVVAVEFESGAVGTLTTSFFTPTINEISVFATKGAAYNLAAGARLQLQAWDGSERNEVELDPIDPLVDELTEFAHAVRGETEVEVDGETALAVIAVLEAAQESAATGRAVEVGEKG
ncbi:MAG: Gfo/Idh/MocA family oxidoreductase [Acidimicrobiia bacterium]